MEDTKEELEWPKFGTSLGTLPVDSEGNSFVACQVVMNKDDGLQQMNYSKQEIIKYASRGSVVNGNYLSDAVEIIKKQDEINVDLLDNLTRIIDRIEENNLQDNFPSAYIRAKKAIDKTL